MEVFLNTLAVMQRVVAFFVSFAVCGYTYPQKCPLINTKNCSRLETKYKNHKIFGSNKYKFQLGSLMANLASEGQHLLNNTYRNGGFHEGTLKLLSILWRPANE